MRVTAALAACLLAFGSTAHAQVSGVMLPVPPLPPIGLPLPHIGLPVPNADTRSADRQRDDDSARPRPNRGRVRMPTFLVLPPVIVAPERPRVSSAAEGSTPAPAARVVEPGTLDIVMEGVDDFQVFVDGYFAGSGQQAAHSLTLDAGSHDVELRAEGHEPKTFKVRISPGQTMTYRDTLARSETQADRPDGVPAQSPTQAGPVYVIPGCYAGNVPPAEATLPRGCDPSRAVVLGR